MVNVKVMGGIHRVKNMVNVKLLRVYTEVKIWSVSRY